MRPLLLALLGASVLASPLAAAPQAAGTLRVISIDVEGGAATLFVTPEGKTLLIDTGWPPEMAARVGSVSAERIAAAAASVGVSKIDDLIITHYHTDHIGGVAALVEKLPVGTFIDHGENREPPPPDLDPAKAAGSTDAHYRAYLKLIGHHKHVVVKPGDTLKIGSMNLTFVTSDAQTIARPLPGAGKTNPDCDASLPVPPLGGEENSRSVGTIIRYGKTRIAALGDLSWPMEIALFCPVDKVGPVDVLIATQHASLSSSNPASVMALRPVVTVAGNGANKGGDPLPFKTLAASPGLEGLWRTHGNAKHPEIDGDPDYIANPNGTPDAGHAIHVDVTQSGMITVTNDRTGFSKTYQARGQ